MNVSAPESGPDHRHEECSVKRVKTKIKRTSKDTYWKSFLEALSAPVIWATDEQTLIMAVVKPMAA
jgi:hypothetical protein